MMHPNILQTSQINKGSDLLGRYYTKADIGDLLIAQMAGIAPNRVLDLGAGAGSLSRAALEQWGNIELVTVDVDAEAKHHLKILARGNPGARHCHIHIDALSDRLPKLLSERTDSIDTAVCNPPFIIPKWRKGFAHILEEAGFSGCLPSLSDVDAALLFLAQNLRLLSAKATLGIIVPDGLISASKYRLFRKQLIEKYFIHRAIRLPRHSFVGTDAQAYILVIGKGDITHQQQLVSLQKFHGNAQISSELLVDTRCAIDRLDFEYHLQQEEITQYTLGSLAIDIKRGSFSSSESRSTQFPVLHTTDMTADLMGKWCDLQDFGVSHTTAHTNHRLVQAQPGDILLARIGRNLEQKVFGIASGFPILSDCVYRIRLPRNLQKRVLKQLASPRGQAWLKSRSYGVSAKQLSKIDLQHFPLTF